MVYIAYIENDEVGIDDDFLKVFYNKDVAITYLEKLYDKESEFYLPSKILEEKDFDFYEFFSKYHYFYSNVMFKSFCLVEKEILTKREI